MEFYSIESIKLTDYNNGRKQICPVKDILPLFKRTENQPTRLVEDKWLDWCNRIYRYKWTNIKLVIKFI